MLSEKIYIDGRRAAKYMPTLMCPRKNGSVTQNECAACQWLAAPLAENYVKCKYRSWLELPEQLKKQFLTR